MNDLKIVSENNLSKHPIRIEVLVENNICKDAMIKNEIGHIMSRYNIIEYKSLGDSLTIDDFFKILGYACLFKSSGKHVNEYRIEEITVSIFSSNYPRTLFEELKINGFVTEEKYAGIYYVSGNIPIPTQIVVINRLEKSQHSDLFMYANNGKVNKRSLYKESEPITKQTTKTIVDAILQSCMSITYELFDEIRESSNICETMRRLMHDDIKEEIERRHSEERLLGKLDGITEGKIESLKNLIANLSCTVEQAMDLLEIPLTQREQMSERL